RKAHSRSCYGNNRFSITNPRSEKLRAPVFIQAPQIVSVSTRRSGLLFLPFEADNPAATPIIRSLVLLGAGSDAGDKSHERVLLWSAFSIRGARLGASSWPAGTNSRRPIESARTSHPRRDSLHRIAPHHARSRRYPNCHTSGRSI